MKAQYVSDLVEGLRVDAAFAIRSRDLRRARTGDAYLSLELGDRSGTIPGVMFRPSSSDEAVPAGTVVRVRGTVTSYRGVRRVSIESMRPEDDYDRSDLLPAGMRAREELLEEMRALARGVRHRGLRSLLGAFFGDRRLLDRFATCPATRARHHAYVGGLLEHSVAVATVCRDLASCYPLADADLLITAALLHDVGRIDGLAFQTTVEHTDAGRMLGHVVLGERVVARAVERLGEVLPADVALQLSHLILSHHGEAQEAMSVPPRTIEALLLRHADSMDAAVAGFTNAVAGAAVLQERWTDESNLYGRRLRVPGGERVEPSCPARAACSTIDAVPA